MKIIIPVLLFAVFLSACSYSNEKAAQACLEKFPNEGARNVSSNLNGIQSAISKSTDIGACLAEKLDIDSYETDSLKAQAVLDFVSKVITYKVDTSGTKMPSKTLREREGDCEDYTALKGSVLHAASVDFYLIERPPFKNGELGHVFLAIETQDHTGMECDNKNLLIVDGTDTAATVGVDSNNRDYEFKCRLIN